MKQICLVKKQRPPLFSLRRRFPAHELSRRKGRLGSRATPCTRGPVLFRARQASRPLSLRLLSLTAQHHCQFGQPTTKESIDSAGGCVEFTSGRLLCVSGKMVHICSSFHLSAQVAPFLHLTGLWQAKLSRPPPLASHGGNWGDQKGRSTICSHRHEQTRKQWPVCLPTSRLGKHI